MTHCLYICVLHVRIHVYIYAKHTSICLRICNVCTSTRVEKRVYARVTNANRQTRTITHATYVNALQRKTKRFARVLRVRATMQKSSCETRVYECCMKNNNMRLHKSLTNTNPHVIFTRIRVCSYRAHLLKLRKHLFHHTQQTNKSYVFVAYA